MMGFKSDMFYDYFLHVPFTEQIDVKVTEEGNFDLGW